MPAGRGARRDDPIGRAGGSDAVMASPARTCRWLISETAGLTTCSSGFVAYWSGGDSKAIRQTGGWSHPARGILSAGGLHGPVGMTPAEAIAA